MKKYVRIFAIVVASLIALWMLMAVIGIIINPSIWWAFVGESTGVRVFAVLFWAASVGVVYLVLRWGLRVFKYSPDTKFSKKEGVRVK